MKKVRLVDHVKEFLKLISFFVVIFYLVGYVGGLPEDVKGDWEVLCTTRIFYKKVVCSVS